MRNRFWPTAELGLGEDLYAAILLDPTGKARGDVWICENAKAGSGIAPVHRTMVWEAEEIAPVIGRLREGLRAQDRDVALVAAFRLVLMRAGMTRFHR